MHVVDLQCISYSSTFFYVYKATLFIVQIYSHTGKPNAHYLNARSVSDNETVAVVVVQQPTVFCTGRIVVRPLGCKGATYTRHTLCGNILHICQYYGSARPNTRGTSVPVDAQTPLPTLDFHHVLSDLYQKTQESVDTPWQRAIDVALCIDAFSLGIESYTACK